MSTESTVKAYINEVTATAYTTYRQGSSFVAKGDFTVKYRPAKGRASTFKIKVGQEFWMVSPEYEQKSSGVYKVARKGKNMADSYPFNASDFHSIFQILK